MRVKDGRAWSQRSEQRSPFPCVAGALLSLLLPTPIRIASVTVGMPTPFVRSSAAMAALQRALLDRLPPSLRPCLLSVGEQSHAAHDPRFAI
eukprot:6206599-Pleurochrysis_carterae.AAC.5